ncbi:MAG: short-chain dehydrogenase/reductase [Labilithrix sp.]|nr:short-chain dehydrogenase/reductase [Labilithrix sp.]
MKTTGNTILITGGGTGIGEALAHRFHDLGNTVIVAGRRLETLQKAVGDRRRMHAMTLDMDDPANVAAFAEKLVASFPGLNVLFNSAGIMRMETSLDTLRDLRDAEASITTSSDVFGKAAIHSYTVSLRTVLKRKVEVIELVPPAVRTELTPGQNTNDRFMPLETFADQVMTLFQQTPTPPEILVEGVDFMRHAEAEGRFPATLAAINPFLK